jgi:RNA polymerase sigma factor (sigma-70 family)
MTDSGPTTARERLIANGASMIPEDEPGASFDQMPPHEQLMAERLGMPLQAAIEYVNSVARNLVRDPLERENLVQEVFLRLLRLILKGGGPVGESAAYLRKTTVVTWRELHRTATTLSRGKGLTASLDASPLFERPHQDPSGLPWSNRGDFRDPAEVATDKVLFDLVLESLERLPQPLRDVVQLIDVEGLTRREVAARLGEPLSTIQSRLKSAHARLRADLLRTQTGHGNV